jgi:hypothetical protein
MSPMIATLGRPSKYIKARRIAPRLANRSELGLTQNTWAASIEVLASHQPVFGRLGLRDKPREVEKILARRGNRISVSIIL